MRGKSLSLPILYLLSNCTMKNKHCIERNKDIGKKERKKWKRKEEREKERRKKERDNVQATGCTVKAWLFLPPVPEWSLILPQDHQSQQSEIWFCSHFRILSDQKLPMPWSIRNVQCLDLAALMYVSKPLKALNSQNMKDRRLSDSIPQGHRMKFFFGSHLPGLVC